MQRNKIVVAALVLAGLVSAGAAGRASAPHAEKVECDTFELADTVQCRTGGGDLRYTYRLPAVEHHPGHYVLEHAPECKTEDDCKAYWDGDHWNVEAVAH